MLMPKTLRLQTAIRLISLVLLPLIWFFPAANAWAETTPATTSTDTATSSSSIKTTPTTTSPKPIAKVTKPKAPPTGPTKPTGPDANTYTYNASTGLWENAHYTWDPATNQTAPKDSPSYSYNPSTGMWDNTQWRYDAPSGQYVANTTSSSQSPDDANPTTNSTATNSPDTAIDGTVSNSGSSIKQSNNDNAAFNLFYNAKISNNFNSTATSGDALVAQNTLAGDALSGNAQAMANIINMLQSSWNLNGGQPTTFINTVNGDVYGDISIDPSHLPTSTLATNKAQNSNLDINVQNSGQINNNIDLAANSGNATVTKNTQAGNATTGSAQAIADIVNMINSTIASGKSFVGMVNINGNFNGDILMPADMINQLLASNSVPKTTINTANIENNGAILANFTNNSAINNQVKTSANSGNATVSNNTAAGNAKTGNASTNLTVLNLTGQAVIGKDALLVFVNVQGQWIGMIVNAPAGATSALLGGGITSASTNNNANINGTSDMSINNAIDVSAKSGDATVNGNTQAGNAKSGDATASVNLANLLNSSFSLSNWFGILFINITGNWIGSFGINTAAGNPIISSTGHKVNAGVQVFRFTPSGSGKTKLTPVYSNTSNANGGNPNNGSKAILASSKNNKGVHPTLDAASTNTKSSDKHMNSWWLPIFSVIGASAFLGTERIEDYRNKKKVTSKK